MSQIIDVVTSLEEEIGRRGVSNRDTTEILNVNLELPNVNSDIEEEGTVRVWYDSRYGAGQFADKCSQEAHHYQYLKYGLFSKLDYNRFYFKEGPKFSRKLVMHSEDCISLVQILPREGREMMLTAYMRSSDIKRLLPVDLLGLVEIGNNVIGAIYDPYEDPNFAGVKLNMQVYIGSAHIYLEGSSPR